MATGPYQAVPIRPAEQAHYDAADSAFERGEFAHEGEREMDVLRAQPQHAATFPDQQAMQNLAHQGDAAVHSSAQDVAHVAQAQHTVTNIDGQVAAISGGSSGMPGPMAGKTNAINRARDNCVGLITGALGMIIAGGMGASIVLTLKLTGYLDAAESLASGKAPSDPSTTELDLWLKLPNDSLFNLIWASAVRQEWSVSTWNYVMKYLAKICQTAVPPASQSEFDTLRVTDAVLATDFSGWLSSSFGPKDIFDKSVKYPGPNTSSIDADLFRLLERAVRLDYLARIYDKASEELNI